MLKVSNFIILPYTYDLTQAGVAYACRSLAYTYNRMSGTQFEWLRRIVVRKAGELAFRRLLIAQAIPHNNLDATPFSGPGHFTISLGGWRCDLINYLIHQKSQISLLRKHPGKLLKTMVQIPRDQIATANPDAHQIYIFGFTYGLLASQGKPLARAVAAGQPIEYLSILPTSWARPQNWRSLAPLRLKAEASENLGLQLGGLNSRRQFQTKQVQIHPQKPTQIQSDFYTLAYLQRQDPLKGRTGIHSLGLDQLHVIAPQDWENIYVYGLEIILCGYITGAEFRRQGQPMPPGSQVFPYIKTRNHNIALPVSELHPLADLFFQAKAWQSRSRSPGNG